MASALVEETSVPAATPSSPPQLLTFGDHRPPTQIPRWIVLLGALVAQAVLTRAMMSYPAWASPRACCCSSSPATRCCDATS
ncbi:MAG: hypothetical protein R2702_11395 [Acidimicrobiales bacterium]